MPEYRYRCTKCKDEFDIIESIKADPQVYCSICDANTLERIIFACHFSCHNITTVGQLAEYNTKKLGKYGLEKKELEDANRRNYETTEDFRKAVEASGGQITSKERKGKKGKHWGTKDPKEQRRKINKMTPEQKKRYILDGD